MGGRSHDPVPRDVSSKYPLPGMIPYDRLNFRQQCTELNSFPENFVKSVSRGVHFVAALSLKSGSIV